MIVLHYTAMAARRLRWNGCAILSTKCPPHYLIGTDGTLWQMVREEDRAWHAGAGEWHGLKDINSRSIGIELDNAGTHPFTEPQMAVLEGLMCQIMARWTIRTAGVIGHSDLAPGRKFDPGPRFDWARLERLQLAARRGIDDGPQDTSPHAFRALARAAGFTAETDDETLLAAIRLRYRPWATGPLDPADFSPLGHAVERT